MWTSKTSLLLLLVLSFTFAVESYRIVKVDTENRVYLLLRGNCRPILEPTTWRSFGYSIGTGSESPCELQRSDSEVHAWRTAPGTTSLSGEWVGLSVCMANVSTFSELQCNLGAPVPLIQKRDNTPDEMMRVELLRISVIMGDLVPHGSLLVEPTLVGGYINPTVVPWQRGLLLMTGLAWLAADGVNPSETVQFRILSPRAMSEAHVVNRPTEDLPYPVRVAGTYSDAGKAVTGIGQLLQPLDQPFLGQDPRALALSPDRLLVVFTNRFTATLSMGLAVLTVNGTARPDYLQGTYPAGDGPGAAVPYNHMLKDLPYLAEASKTPPYRGHQAADGRNLVLSHLYPSVGAAEALHQHHKNWAPFLYRRAGDNASLAYHIYLVKYINPLTVVQPDWESVDPHSGHVGVRLVSQAPKANLSFWGYGELRGGTPARRMPDGRFLAFFHSSGKIGRWFTSYVTGAYVFSAEPPFRLLAITPLPVLAPNFYTGNYAEKANRHLDYVVFPMSFFFEDELEAADGAPHAQTGARALRSHQTHARSRGQKHTTVILSFGAQDREGWLARVPLHALLDSMVNVPAADVSR